MRIQIWFMICAVLLLASTMGFAQWHALPAGQPEIVAFAADSSGQRMILSTSGAGVWLTNNGGATWEPINSRLSDFPDVFVIHLDIPDAAGQIILSDPQTEISG
jgi:hypothetical protein